MRTQTFVRADDSFPPPLFGARSCSGLIDRTWSSAKRPQPPLAISGARNLTESGTPSVLATRGSEALSAGARRKRRSLPPSMSRCAARLRRPRPYATAHGQAQSPTKNHKHAATTNTPAATTVARHDRVTSSAMTTAGREPERHAEQPRGQARSARTRSRSRASRRCGAPTAAHRPRARAGTRPRCRPRTWSRPSTRRSRSGATRRSPNSKRFHRRGSARSRTRLLRPWTATRPRRARPAPP